MYNLQAYVYLKLCTFDEVCSWKAYLYITSANALQNMIISIDSQIMCKMVYIVNYHSRMLGGK